MRTALCVLLLVVMVVMCLAAFGCGKKVESKDAEPDQKAMGQDLINKAGSPPASDDAGSGDGG